MNKRHLAFVWLILASLVMVAGSIPMRHPVRAAGSSRLYLPLVVAPMPPVRVTEIVLTRTRATTFRILGEVLNVSSSPVFSVTLDVKLYDADNQPLGTITAHPVLVATLPGQPNPFDAVSNIPFVDEARTEVVIAGWSTVHPRDYRPVTVVSMRTRIDFDDAYVEGELRNDQAEALEDVQLVVWHLNQKVSIGSTQIALRLEPRGTATYSWRVRNAGTTSIRIAAQGKVAP